MDLATPDTVLGDFNNVQFTHFDITSRMYRQDGKYMVYTEGPDGQLHDYEVKYVFGVDPLQNYMVEFDRTPDMSQHEIGRLQVLRITWDTKKRWFYIPPPDVDESCSRTTICTGHASPNAGTTCVPTAIRRTCRRITTLRPGPTEPLFPRSTSVAKRAMGRPVCMWSYRGAVRFSGIANADTPWPD